MERSQGEVQPGPDRRDPLPRARDRLPVETRVGELLEEVSGDSDPDLRSHGVGHGCVQVHGLAGLAAQMIESAGVRVIQVDESPGIVDYCEVAASGGRQQTAVVRWLVVSFGCSFRADDSRGQIVDMTIGEGYAKNFGLP